MELQGFAQYLEIWNMWIVFPALAIAALIYHIRKRKTSTILIFIGLLFFVFGELGSLFYKNNPLHPIYIACAIFVVIGLVAGITGCFLYWRKDYVSHTKNT
ncbi:MAG TPA: hypothetical protein VIE91_04985 [Methylophilaceae bacterium]